MNNSTDNHGESTQVLSPDQMQSEMPLPALSMQTVYYTRNEIKNILVGNDNRLMVICGPCSIHDPDAALDYAYKLQKLSTKVSEKMLLIMRVYLEKPRTSIGWKGLINDPHLDGSCDIAEGLRTARKLLIDITASGLGAGTEMLDPMISPYISDLISYASIGARTTESQTHRQFASSLPMPVGFKNSTDGTLDSAVHAIMSVKNSHSFLGMNNTGRVCIVRTKGNHYGHLILRGGKTGTNYDIHSLHKAEGLLNKNDLNPALIIDCSHMNALKKYQNQSLVWKDSITNYLNGGSCIRGLMVESNLFEGNQELRKGPLKYGVSITDECIGWNETEELLLKTYNQLSKPGQSSYSQADGQTESVKNSISRKIIPPLGETMGASSICPLISRISI